ncbi:MAG: AAA family ATPase, partial [Symploca sp. SIO2B6]|nr:AAA family ATPase [Symploca sp. SIO2B6]
MFRASSPTQKIGASGLNIGLSTILVSGVTNRAGKTTVLQALKTYWHRHCSEQTVSCLTIPEMESVNPGEEHNLAELWQLLSQHQFDHDRVILEGAGSLGTPVTFDTTVAALARDWRLPTLLVVPVEWDAIAPAVATVALARQTCLDLIGIVLNHRPSFHAPER